MRAKKPTPGRVLFSLVTDHQAGQDGWVIQPGPDVTERELLDVLLVFGEMLERRRRAAARKGGN